MTDNISNSPDTKELAEFIRRQIDINRKATKNTWIVGIILLAVVTCYMSFSLYMLRSILVPQTAARMIAQSVEANLPSAIDEGGRALKLQAPLFADAVSERLMSALPAFRKRGEKLIDLACDDMLPLLREEIRSSVDTFMDLHRDEIVAAFEGQTEDGMPEQVVEELLSDVRTSLNEALREGCDGQDLTVLRESTYDALFDVREELARLNSLTPDKMTEEDRLERRMIVTWLVALDEITWAKDAGAEPRIEL